MNIQAIYIDCPCTRLEGTEIKKDCPQCHGTGKLRVLEAPENDRKIEKEII